MSVPNVGPIHVCWDIVPHKWTFRRWFWISRNMLLTELQVAFHLEMISLLRLYPGVSSPCVLYHILKKETPPREVRKPVKPRCTHRDCRRGSQDLGCWHFLLGTEKACSPPTLSSVCLALRIGSIISRDSISVTRVCWLPSASLSYSRD